MDNQSVMRTFGENGAVELTAEGVGNARVACFFKLVRSLPPAQLSGLVAEVLLEHKQSGDAQILVDLLVMTFQTRACRGAGKGEKSLFYSLLLECYAELPETVLRLVELIPHYGYWKDMFLLLEHLKKAGHVAGKERLKERVMEVVAEQLKEDTAEMEKAEAESRPPKMSLLAKWVPKEGKHFDRELGAAGELAAIMYGNANKMAARRKYRQAVSKLNKALNTTEVLMAAHRYEEIQFDKVASLCLNRNRKAFMNEKLKQKPDGAEVLTGNRFPEDEGRVAARKNLTNTLLNKGLKGKQLQPHEIVSKIHRKSHTLSDLEHQLLGSQWEAVRAGVMEQLEKAAQEQQVEMAAEGGGLSGMGDLSSSLPKKVDLGRLVPLVDVSGSMSGTPMQVAIALGILVSELTHDTFRDRFITFESQPQWVDLSGCGTLVEKVEQTARAPWGGSTDFAAACEMILSASVRAKLTPDQIPDLIVFSDMQFNEALALGDYGYYAHSYYRSPSHSTSWETHHERLSRKFHEAGVKVCGQPYACPRVIFWNLRGDTVGFPAAASAPNTQMISGFSPSLLKLVLSGEDMMGEEEVGEDGRVTKEGPTPYQTLRKALDDSHYDAVRVGVAEVGEGALEGYEVEKDGFSVV